MSLESLLPQQPGETHECWVQVSGPHRHPMRLLLLRVPPEVAARRHANLEADAKQRGEQIRKRAWELAAWTILLTDVPADLLTLQEALVLLTERWQMEMLSKLWKQEGRLDTLETGGAAR